MKRAFLSSIGLFLSLSILAQPFEGKIVYHNTYKSKIASLSDVQLSSMMGPTIEYFIKGGNYRSNLNGSFAQWQLYINADNKLYNKFANTQDILWNDGAINNDEVLSSVLNKGVIEIAGYKCDELILTCKTGIQKYYFNSKLSVDPAVYANHKYGNWYEYLSKSKSIPLKSIVENAQFVMESVAIEVKPMKLDDKLFTLPDGAKTAKSPY